MNAAQNPLEKEKGNVSVCELRLTLDLFSGTGLSNNLPFTAAIFSTELVSAFWRSIVILEVFQA